MNVKLVFSDNTALSVNESLDDNSGTLIIRVIVYCLSSELPDTFILSTTTLGSNLVIPFNIVSPIMFAVLVVTGSNKYCFKLNP